MEKTSKQKFTGVVVSDKMNQSVVVRIDSKKRHPKYHKAYTVSKKLTAHNPGNLAKKGDTVVVEATRPISKTKRFVVVNTTNS